uniref:G_PROTEIN_RECEP_F1_2 domain-containing protein n=2 Tax=Steinernema glaseri TaxID=37863 RepID=A0A1I7YZB7_9BILA
MSINPSTYAFERQVLSGRVHSKEENVHSQLGFQTMASDLYNQNIYLNVVLRSILGILSAFGNALVIFIIFRNKNALKDGFNVLLLQLALGDFFIAFGNALVIFIIFRNKNALKDGFNVLLLQLALGDFFIGFGNIFRVLESLLVHFKVLAVTPINCFVPEIPLLIGLNLSQLIMFLIAVDRFICITQLHGTTLINNKTFIWIRACSCIAFVLFVSLAVLIGLDTTKPPGVKTCYITMGWSKSYMVYFSSLTSFFSIAIVVAYVLTFISYWWYKKQASNSIIHRERRIAQTLILIVVAYLLCWCLPRLITIVYSRLGVENGLSRAMTGSIGYLNAVNSIVNVAIYGFKHRQIRSGFLNLIGFASTKYVAGNRLFTTVSSTMNHR